MLRRFALLGGWGSWMLVVGSEVEEFEIGGGSGAGDCVFGWLL